VLLILQVLLNYYCHPRENIRTLDVKNVKSDFLGIKAMLSPKDNYHIIMEKKFLSWFLKQIKTKI